MVCLDSSSGLGLDNLEYLDGLICFMGFCWDGQMLSSYKVTKKEKEKLIYCYSSLELSPTTTTKWGHAPAHSHLSDLCFIHLLVSPQGKQALRSKSDSGMEKQALLLCWESYKILGFFLHLFITALFTIQPPQTK